MNLKILSAYSPPTPALSALKRLVEENYAG
jgi:hypothetical protein